MTAVGAGAAVTTGFTGATERPARGATGFDFVEMASDAREAHDTDDRANEDPLRPFLLERTRAGKIEGAGMAPEPEMAL